MLFQCSIQSCEAFALSTVVGFDYPDPAGNKMDVVDAIILTTCAENYDEISRAGFRKALEMIAIKER